MIERTNEVLILFSIVKVTLKCILLKKIGYSYIILRSDPPWPTKYSITFLAYYMRNYCLLKA